MVIPDLLLSVFRHTPLDEGQSSLHSLLVSSVLRPEERQQCGFLSKHPLFEEGPRCQRVPDDADWVQQNYLQTNILLMLQYFCLFVLFRIEVIFLLIVGRLESGLGYFDAGIISDFFILPVRSQGRLVAC